jgi:hypothetical protein
MEKKNLQSMSVVELKNLAKKRKIEGISKLKKAELIEKLQKPKRKEDGTCQSIKFKPREKENPYIENFYCLELPLSKIKYLLGPYKFYKFRIGSRNLYLFGEYHQLLSDSLKEIKNTDAKKSNTLLFSSFVHSLVSQNPDKTYDLMVELSGAFDNKFPEFENAAMVNNIQSQFISCLTRDKKHCAYKNLRVHYVDYRHQKDETGKKYIHSKKPFDVLLKEFLSFGKIFKQISNIKDEKIKQKFTQFFVDYASKKPDQANDIKMAVMDIYAMARIFRDFENVKRNVHSFTGTSQNVIYYVGGDHIEVMVQFLTKYLKLKPIFKTGFCASDNEAAHNIHENACLSFLKLNVSKHF